MAQEMSLDATTYWETLFATVMPEGATPEQGMAFLVVAKEHGLNPITKEIYAYPGRNGGIQPVVSVDGWIKLANSHPQMDGIDYKWNHDKDTGALISCTAVVYRKDRGHPVTATEYYSENRQNTPPWKTRPHRMLQHRATCQGFRIAFGFAGVMEETEYRDWVDAESTEVDATDHRAEFQLAMAAAVGNGSLSAAQQAVRDAKPTAQKEGWYDEQVIEEYNRAANAIANRTPVTKGADNETE